MISSAGWRHQRGNNHTTRRLGGEIELVAHRQLTTMEEARALEFELKRKKNPQVAIYLLRFPLFG